MKTETRLSINLLRRIALMQHLGQDYFFVDGIAYEGKESEAREQFEEDIEGTEEASIDVNFSIFCSNNLPELQPLDIEDSYENDYYVLTDEEADEKTAEYIKDTLWAFTPSFLADQTDLPIEVFEAIASNNKCESNNEAIERIIYKMGDIEGFVNAAISADGRGHFLSSYDGNENEEVVILPEEVTTEMMEEAVVDTETTFYIYRIN